MKSNKSFIELIFERMLEMNIPKAEPTQKETFEVTKGKYKTQIDVLFTEDGYPAGYSMTTEAILPTPEEEKANTLQLQLQEAVEKEDYETAARLQKEMRDLSSVQQK